MQQLYHLTCLVPTIPVSTSSVEVFLDPEVHQDGCQEHNRTRSLLSVEKGLLLELKSKEELYDATNPKIEQTRNMKSLLRSDNQ